MKRGGLLAIIGPGILVAATGVGAGDLATASFTGSQLGVAVLWAVLVGAFIKFVLNEGLARWQLATGQTLLEGCMAHLGRTFQALFLVYFVAWSFLVGCALMAACGVTFYAILPLFEDPGTAQIWFGILHSAAGLLVSLAANLEGALGPVGKWAFLLGAWGAIFSSLLGVWQSIPYIFADFWTMLVGDPPEIRKARMATTAPLYKGYLFALAVVPILGLYFFGFKDLQKYYALTGAVFMPFLAVVLLALNGRRAWVGLRHRNRPATTGMLTAIAVFFVIAGWMAVRNKFGS